MVSPMDGANNPPAAGDKKWAHKGPSSYRLAEREGLLGAMRLALRAAVCDGVVSAGAACLGSNHRSVSRLRIRLRRAIKNGPTRGPVLIAWRRGRDSNPRYGVTVYTLSRRAPSTARPPLHNLIATRHPARSSDIFLAAHATCALFGVPRHPHPFGGVRRAFWMPCGMRAARLQHRPQGRNGIRRRQDRRRV